MRYLSERTSWVVFSTSVIVVIVLGIAASAMTSRYAESEKWVAHTREVGTRLPRTRADMLAVESARTGYILSGDEGRLSQFSDATKAIHHDVEELRSLTRDNPSQDERLDAPGGDAGIRLKVQEWGTSRTRPEKRGTALLRLPSLGRI